MNLLVLVVAGVFVAAGLVLIVLSFLVGRSRLPKGLSEEVAEAPNATGQADASAFIDEPLATDLAKELEGRKKTEATAELAAEVAAPTRSEKQDGAAAGMPAQATETRTAAGQGETQTLAPTANHVGFNFRVQLGFKFLQNGLHEDGVAEFQKALSLTQDREAKLKLYVEIGNAFRAQKMFGPAGAAYTQAASYTDNEMLLEHLERTIAEMMDTDNVGAASSGSGSEKEE
ncbi:MAG: hypothetical protein ACYC5Q_09920 [Thermoleophilia bacterium]